MLKYCFGMSSEHPATKEGDINFIQDKRTVTICITQEEINFFKEKYEWDIIRMGLGVNSKSKFPVVSSATGYRHYTQFSQYLSHLALVIDFEGTPRERIIVNYFNENTKKYPENYWWLIYSKIE